MLVGQNKSLDFSLLHEQKCASKIYHPPVSGLKGTNTEKKINDTSVWFIEPWNT